MSKGEMYISFASWEERFLLGGRKALTSTYSEAILFFLDAYRTWTKSNREEFEKTCSERNIKLTPCSIDNRLPAASWHQMSELVLEKCSVASKVTVDISTMPREIIWSLLWLLELTDAEISYCYNSPEDYSPDWLSRDPGIPRFVFKLSGLSIPDSSNALIISAGYDIQRVRQLISRFEPAKVIIAVQSGDPFESNRLYLEKYRGSLGMENGIRLAEVDFYASDCGLDAIESFVKEFDKSYNVLMTSLGPKLNAIAMYKIQRLYPSVGLVYAPSNQFNKEYSHGLGKAYRGVLERPPVADEQSNR